MQGCVMAFVTCNSFESCLAEGDFEGCEHVADAALAVAAAVNRANFPSEQAQGAGRQAQTAAQTDGISSLSPQTQNNDRQGEQESQQSDKRLGKVSAVNADYSVANSKPAQRKGQTKLGKKEVAEAAPAQEAAAAAAPAGDGEAASIGRVPSSNSQADAPTSLPPKPKPGGLPKVRGQSWPSPEAAEDSGPQVEGPPPQQPPFIPNSDSPLQPAVCFFTAPCCTTGQGRLPAPRAIAVTGAGRFPALWGVAVTGSGRFPTAPTPATTLSNPTPTALPLPANSAWAKKLDLKAAAPSSSSLPSAAAISAQPSLKPQPSSSSEAAAANPAKPFTQTPTPPQPAAPSSSSATASEESASRSLPEPSISTPPRPDPSSSSSAAAATSEAQQPPSTAPASSSTSAVPPSSSPATAQASSSSGTANASTGDRPSSAGATKKKNRGKKKGGSRQAPAVSPAPTAVSSSSSGQRGSTVNEVPAEKGDSQPKTSASTVLTAPGLSTANGTEGQRTPHVSLCTMEPGTACSLQLCACSCGLLVMGWSSH